MEEGRGIDEKKGVVAGVGGGKGKEQLEEGKKEALSSTVNVKQAQQRQVSIQYILVYKSRVEDRKWANSGMVASVIAGDSALLLQQRVDDDNFLHVVVTSMGAIESSSIAPEGRIFGKCSTGQSIYLVCYSLIFTSGRRRRLGMNVGLVCVLMVFPFILGMMFSSDYVFRELEDLFMLTNAR